MANVKKKISELTSLTSASLDTVVVGVDNGTTYKIELDVLADGVRDRINTLDYQRLNSLETITASVNNNLSSLNSFTASQTALNTAFTNGINGRLTTSSFNSFSASVHSEILAATNEQSFNGLISGSSQLTSSYDSRYVLSGSITQTTWDNISGKPSGLVSQSTDLTSLNSFTASNGNTSLNAATSSYETKGNGIVSGSSQLTSSFDTRYTLSGSVQPLPDGLVSSSAQITALGFISESVDLTSLNNFTASISTASLVTSINNLNTATSSYETTGRGIISESVVTISDTQPSTGIGNLWYDSNGGNLYLHYDTNTWVDTSNGVIQTILTDGSLLSTASFNSWTASFTASVPAGTISSSAQISSFGFVISLIKSKLNNCIALAPSVCFFSLFNSL